jgi:hypothetical protein
MADGTLSPAGYTGIFSPNLFGNDSHDTNFQIAYKFMGSTPDTSVDIRAASDTARGVAYTIHVFRGVDPTTPLDVTSTSASGNNTGLPNAPSITPSTAGAWILISGASAMATGTAPSTTPPTGISNTTNHFRTALSASTTTDAGIATGIKTDWASGAFDAAAFGGFNTTNTGAWAAGAIALRPFVAVTHSAASSLTADVTATADATIIAGTVTHDAASSLSGSLTLTGNIDKLCPVDSALTAAATLAADATIVGGTVVHDAAAVLTTGVTATAAADIVVLWKPTDLTTDPVHWFDAQDSGTLTIDGSTNVSQWNNKGTAAANAAQATAGSRPAYVASSNINSLPALRVNNAAKGLTLTTSLTGLNNLQFTTNSATLGATVGAVSVTPTNLFGSLLLSPHILEVIWDQTAGTIDFLVNGTSITQYTGQTLTSSGACFIMADAQSAGSGNTAFPNNGRYFRQQSTTTTLFNQGDLQRSFDGDMGEIVYLTYAPTQSEREHIEGYLAHKWNNESTLDVGHTYKSAAPTVVGPTILNAAASLSSEATLVSDASVIGVKNVDAALTGSLTLTAAATRITNLWQPSDLTTDPVHWFDAQDGATITTVGSNVSQWNDKGSGASNAIQATDANRPAYVASSNINSLPALRVDGANGKALTFTSSGPTPLGEISFNGALNNLEVNFDTSSLVFGTGAVFNSTSPSIVEAAWDTTTCTFWENGIQVAHFTGLTISTSGSIFIVQDANTAGGFSRGRYFSNGALFNRTFDYGRAFDGDMGEMVSLNYKPTQAEREKIEGYMAHRWGLAGSLDSGHPYKSAAPLLGPLTLTVDAALASTATLAGTIGVLCPVASNLTASGILSAAVTNIVPVASALSSSVALTGNIQKLCPVSSTLTANLSLAGNIDKLCPVGATLTASGTVTAAANIITILTANAALSTAATLAGDIKAIRVVTSGLSGSGTLTSAVTAIRVVTSSLSGSGTLTANALKYIPVASALSGSLTLAGNIDKLCPVSATLAASGTITAAANIVSDLTSSSSLQASLSLTATVTSIVAVGSAMTGSVTLSGSITNLVKANFAGTATGTLTANADKLVPVAASLSSTVTLSGTITNRVAVSSSLTASATLTAATIARTVVSASLQANVTMLADAGLNGLQSGNAALVATATLAASVSVVTPVAVAMTSSATLGSVATRIVASGAVLSASGSLTGSVSVLVPFQAALTSTAALAGDVNLTSVVQSQLSADTNVDASIFTIAQASGTMTAQGSCFANAFIVPLKRPTRNSFWF